MPKAKKRKSKAKPKDNKSNTEKRIAKTKGKVLRALSRSHGIIKEACRIGKIGRTTFYEWKNTDMAFARTVSDILEDQIDDVESKFLEGIRAGCASRQIVRV